MFLNRPVFGALGEEGVADFGKQQVVSKRAAQAEESRGVLHVYEHQQTALGMGQSLTQRPLEDPNGEELR